MTAELHALGFENCEHVQTAWLAHCDRNDGEPAPYELVKATSICARLRAVDNPMSNCKCPVV